MERGLYIAASGMLSELVRQDQIANDLANSSTYGYKADRAVQRSFGDMLLHNARTGAQIGRLGVGPVIDRIVTDMSPGAIRVTGEPLDMAIDGDGFFAVRTDQGVRYTRGGQFSVSSAGNLVDSMGREVLSQGGQAIKVGRDGKVDAKSVGVFELRNPAKQGEALFTGAAAGRGQGRVRAGALEGSAADPARSMVELIASFRAFEAGQRMIRTVDETLGKAAGQVGSIS